MEIRFSDMPGERPVDAVLNTASDPANSGGDPGGGYYAKITSAKGLRVRFTLPGADTIAHDRVIRALLTLDPDATVRTARAVFQGLADFERQRGKP